MKGSHYLINAVFARAYKLPVSFIAIKIAESKKAIRVYGHGSMDPEGHCARCGRLLTHPGSILIGIGPECLGDWGARDFKLDNMSLVEKARLQALVTERKVDSWIPKSVIKKNTPTEEEIQLPEAYRTEPVKLTGIPAGPAPINPNPGDPPVKSKFTVKSTPTLKETKEWKGEIAIIFPYSYDTLQKVKTLEGRKYHGDGDPKYWTCPIKAYSILKLKEWGFSLDGALAKYVIDNFSEVKGFVDKELGLDTKQTLSKEITIPGMLRNLFPFQKDGVSFIESRKGRALVADEMGLGKTIQALAFLQLHPEYRPAIILCPASLKLNWAKEIQSTMTQRIKIQILEGKTPYRLHGEIIIVNYDILYDWLLTLLQFKPNIIIGDEIHAIKNNDAKRTKAVKLLANPMSLFNTRDKKGKDKTTKEAELLFKQGLAQKAPHFIALSGTPIINRPIEIYNALSIINSSVIPDYWKYAKRYCGAVHNGFGWDFSGATNTEELHKILTDTIMIRRKKADVLKDLPDKIHSLVPITLSNQQEYDAIESDVIGFLRNSKGEQAADKASNAEVIVQIELLKQAAVRGKLNAVINWIQDFLESDEKLVVFATHKFVIDEFMSRFPQIAVKIDGSTSMTDRNLAVEHFQTNPKVKLFIGNIKAAGVGLTLTAASNVAIVELPWTPGDLKQAEDRCHRIGQKDTVNVHMLIVPGTIEEEIAELLDKKTKILDAVLDGKETDQGSLLTALIDSMTKKQRK